MALLALIAGTVSYLHMHLLVELHGQAGWVAALTPMAADRYEPVAECLVMAPHRVDHLLRAAHQRGPSLQ